MNELKLRREINSSSNKGLFNTKKFIQKIRRKDSFDKKVLRMINKEIKNRKLKRVM